MKIDINLGKKIAVFVDGKAVVGDSWMTQYEAEEMGRKFAASGKSLDDLKNAIHSKTRGNASQEDYRRAENAYKSTGDARSKEERLAAAKSTFESAMKRANDPSARAEAKENYEATKKSIESETGDALNHLGEREYQTYAAWRSAARAAGATRFEGDADIANAFNAAGKSVGEWGGDVGSIYKASA